jgi:hypothetical protein
MKPDVSWATCLSPAVNGLIGEVMKRLPVSGHQGPEVGLGELIWPCPPGFKMRAQPFRWLIDRSGRMALGFPTRAIGADCCAVASGQGDC